MGFPPDRCVHAVDEEDTCTICFEVLENPKDTPCEHIFCEECILGSLTHAESCPQCRAPLTVQDLKPPHRTIRVRLSKFEVKCRNESRGCSETVPWEFLAHHEGTCGFADPVEQVAGMLTRVGVLEKMNEEQQQQITQLRQQNQQQQQQNQQQQQQITELQQQTQRQTQQLQRQTQQQQQQTQQQQQQTQQQQQNNKQLKQQVKQASKDLTAANNRITRLEKALDQLLTSTTTATATLGRSTVPRPNQDQLVATTSHVFNASSNKHLVLYSCGDSEYGFGGSQFRKLPFRGAALAGVALGARHVIVWDEQSRLYGFGWGEYGQLGNGRFDSLTRKFVQVDVGDIGGVCDVKCGFFHSVLVTIDKQVFCWGGNEYGQIGVGSSGGDVVTPTAVRVKSASQIIGLACGGCFTILWTVSGLLFVCGHNDHGQLGLGDTTDRNVFTENRVFAGKRVLNVQCGECHVMALIEGQGVFVWGGNDWKQISPDSAVKRMLRPTLLPESSSILSVACGGLHSLFVCNGGRIQTMGANNVGQQGRGKGCSHRGLVAGTNAVSMVTSFQTHCVCIDGDALVGWGRSNDGRLGANITSDQHSPFVMRGLGGKKVVGLPSPSLSWFTLVVVEE